MSPCSRQRLTPFVAARHFADHDLDAVGAQERPVQRRGHLQSMQRHQDLLPFPHGGAGSRVVRLHERYQFPEGLLAYVRSFHRAQSLKQSPCYGTVGPVHLVPDAALAVHQAFLLNCFRPLTRHRLGDRSRSVPEYQQPMSFDRRKASLRDPHSRPDTHSADSEVPPRGPACLMPSASIPMAITGHSSSAGNTPSIIIASQHVPKRSRKRNSSSFARPTSAHVRAAMLLPKA